MPAHPTAACVPSTVGHSDGASNRTSNAVPLRAASFIVWTELVWPPVNIVPLSIVGSAREKVRGMPDWDAGLSQSEGTRTCCGSGK